MFCSNCGAAAETSAKFCSKCATQFASSSKSVSTLDAANELAEQGRLLEAEDLYWTAIESGVEEARVSLAFAFHDARLPSLALNLYEELVEGEFASQVIPQMAEILLDVHNYEGVREIAQDGSSDAIKGILDSLTSVEEKTASYIADVPGLVESWLIRESELQDQLALGSTFEAQSELVQVREILAHYATLLSTPIGSSSSIQQVSVPIAVGGRAVMRDCRSALGTVASRWFWAAHASVLAFTMLDETDPEFPALVDKTCVLIEKKYVIEGRALTQGEPEEYLINNLIYGLNVLGDPRKDFYAALLG